MAAPSYDHDLTDITLAETTTGWSRYGVAGNPGQGADFSQQGTFCVDKQVSNGDGGVYFNNGAGITLGAGDHVWVWHFAATPGITQTIQNKGASVYIGTGTNAVCEYHIAGNDTFGASGRVARCYPINYAVRTTNASSPYRTTTGSPGAAPSLFGGGLVTTATARTNLGVDAIRYGTGAYLTAGELTSAGDPTNNPCTFAGFQAVNDAIANRFGILTLVGGQYELQGRFAIGQNNAGTATLCRFQDSNKNLAFVDCFHAASTFSEIVIDHASTVCNWTNINITALGTTVRGLLTVTAANPTVNITGGTITGIGAITLRSNTTVDGATFRGCNAITQNGATISNCLIAASTGVSALVADTISNLSNIDFVSGGTGHAIEIGAAGTYNFDGLTFAGYAASNGSTGNEAIYVTATTGTVTINVASGTPSYRTAGATVEIVSGQVTTTITVRDINGTAIQGARVYITAAAGGGLAEGTVIINALTNASGQVSDTRSLGLNQPITGYARKASSAPYFQNAAVSGTISSLTGASINVLMLSDE